MRRRRLACESNVRVLPQGAESPDVAEELLLTKDALRILGERDEEIEFLRRELHRDATHADDAGQEVDGEVPDCQTRVLRPRGAAQDGAHAGDELLVHERLDHVVVRPAGKAADAVGRVAAGADHDHREVAVPSSAGLAGAEPAAQLEARRIGQDGVEEDEVEAPRLDELEGRDSPVGCEDLEAVVGQLAREEVPRRPLVFDHQDRLHHAPDASNGFRARPDVLSDESVTT